MAETRQIFSFLLRLHFQLDPRRKACVGSTTRTLLTPKKLLLRYIYGSSYGNYTHAHHQNN